jgi:UDP-N-acetylglucosamine 2-epimerase (non-hydrolysing)
MGGQKRGWREVLKIAVILGTRPEIIKMSPVIRELDRRGLDYFVLHTGQHYSYEMDRVFFDELRLPEEVQSGGWVGDSRRADGEDAYRYREKSAQ